MNIPTKQQTPPWLYRPSDSNVRKLYHTHKWRKYRARYLSVHPLCVNCEREATVVDHMIPARVRPDLFWRADNHQPMCAECHNRKRATED